MKKENIALEISIISIVTSIAATCVAIYRTPELGFDYMGVLVGILSLLTTVLIGWQIYTFIDIKKHSQNLQKISAGTSLEIQKNMAVSESANWMIYHYLLLNEDPLGLNYRFIYHGIACLFHTSQFYDIVTCNAIVKGLLECIVEPKSITVTKSGKNDILKLLYGVKDSDKIDGYLELLNRIALLDVR
ncbi:hypothetical protein [Bacteroides sp.]|uniref:hypothetical protein n=1 Tax=Bacteroides sp. TaxID=29523 RepID=UPI003D12699B